MSLRMSILGLLSIEPMSGYELKRHIDESVGHFWSADHSQIYRTLASLVADGLATRTTIVQHDRPNMHVHEPTKEGLEALDAWLQETVTPQAPREPFLAKLFFVSRLGPQAALDLLRERRQQISDALIALEAITVDEPSAGLDAMLHAATRENGIAHAGAELEWIDRTAAAVRQREPGH